MDGYSFFNITYNVTLIIIIVVGYVIIIIVNLKKGCSFP